MRLSSIKHVCFENIRQKISLSVIYSVLLTVIMPVFVLLNRTAVDGDQKDFLSRITALLVLYCFTVMTFTFISSVSVFSYMHKKRSVDFYGSLPVSRREEFFGRAIAIWLVMNVPMFVIALLGGLISMDMNAFLLILFFSLRLIVTVTASIVFTGFMAVCSGTVASTVMNFVLINSIYPVFTLIVLGMPEMLPGYVSEFKNAIVLSVFSPYLSPFFMIDADFSQVIWILSIMLIVSAGLTVATYHLLNRRKSECAQSKAAFPIPSIAIRFMTSFTAGYVGAIIFYSMFRINYLLFGGSSSEEETITSLAALGIFILGYTLFSFLAHFILHLIYHKGLKGLVKSFILYGSQLAFCLIALSVIVTGAFGYVSRLPELGEISYVNIEDEAEYRQLKYKGEDLTRIKITDKAKIKKIRQIHRDIIKEAEDDNNGIYMSLFTAMFDDFYNKYKLEYHLKDGSKLVRSYRDSEFGNLFEDYNTITYRNILDKVDPGYYDSIEIHDGDNDFEINPKEKKDAQLAAELIAAFKADLERVGETDGYSKGVMSIYFYIDSYTMSFNFNSDYTDTMAVLEKYGFERQS